jgi:hypothetical protein
VIRPVTSAAGGDVERPVRGPRAVGDEAHRLHPPAGGDARDLGDLGRIALLDRDLADAIGDPPVDARRRGGDVERDTVRPGRQRVRVGADLVADVAACGGAVGADQHQVDEPALHQVPAGAVDDDGERDPHLVELPGGQPRALVAGAGLVDPDVDRDAALDRLVDPRQRRPVVDRGEPARVAVGEDLHRPLPAGRLPAALDERRAVLADRPVDRHVLVADPRRLGVRTLGAPRRRQPPDHAHHPVERPD